MSFSWNRTTSNLPSFLRKKIPLTSAALLFSEKPDVAPAEEINQDILAHIRQFQLHRSRALAALNIQGDIQECVDLRAQDAYRKSCSDHLNDRSQ